jgi:hypothetical protein
MRRTLVFLTLTALLAGCICCGNTTTDSTKGDITTATTETIKSDNNPPPTVVTPTTQVKQGGNPFSGIDCFACDSVGDPVAKRDCKAHCIN